MQIYDAFPAPVRAAVAAGEFNFDMTEVLALYRVQRRFGSTDEQAAEYLRGAFRNTAELAHRRDYGG